MLSSPVDIALVVGVVLVIFGPKKVPELGKALGQGIGNFKKALSEAQEEVVSAVKEAERPAQPQASQASQGTKESAPAEPAATVAGAPKTAGSEANSQETA